MNGAIRIESGIPIPEPARAKKNYPWPLLQPGDSFFIPEGKQANVASAANQFARKNGVRFVTRVREEDGVSGVRVWRVE